MTNETCILYREIRLHIKKVFLVSVSLLWFVKSWCMFQLCFNSLQTSGIALLRASLSTLHITS